MSDYKLEFQKYCGTGNDFIIIDNRNFQKMIKTRSDFAKKYCRRGLSIGADGVLFLENSTVADFKMALFQPDGSQAEMCGNGARCIAKYAYTNGIANKEMKFETLAGIIECRINGEFVSVKLTEPKDLRIDKTIFLEELNETYNYSFINTGVPHTVICLENLENINIKLIGNKIRFNNEFTPAGTNVNFIKINNDNSITIRTYERGVEDETLACGTGSSAAALIASLKNNIPSPLTVHTRSGEDLIIHFNNDALKSNNFQNINLYLEGIVDKIYDGALTVSTEIFN